MYLHSRNCEEDFLAIVKKNRKRFPTGVVHSFTGTKSELKALIEMDLYIGNLLYIKIIFRSKWMFYENY